MLFREDDRPERPFVVLEIEEEKVSNTWFAIFNLKTLQIQACHLIPMQQKELSHIDILAGNDI